ncbi:hypothetical protein NNC19_18055 [Clostridium sp. SHJSY1]|nr:hypothetical protein [Clostridium sp. SHJSY1]MDS0527597.1 hypothetical protein [Clostridium sp. SHJSY1]
MGKVIDFIEYKKAKEDEQCYFESLADLIERGELTDEEIRLFLEKL